MGVTVSINHPAFPEGTEFGIDHLGVVPNGGSLEVPEENEQVFVSQHLQSVADAFKGDDIVSVSGSSDVEVPEGYEPPGPEQGVTTESGNSEEQGQEQAPAPTAQSFSQRQEAPKDTESSEGQVS